MNLEYNTYQNPLSKGYASSEMSYNFSPNRTYSLWRELWYVLAISQKELGLEISDKALQEIKDNITNIDFERVAQLEADLKHDVMAHLHEFGEKCPTAKPILHLGVTSVYVKDNTELIQMRDGLLLLKARVKAILNLFVDFIEKYKSQPTLGFTHFQPAQLTTVGKRAVLWAQSLVWDLEELLQIISWLPFRGVKGTVGTGDSFEKLMHSYDLFLELDTKVRKNFGFTKTLYTGQIYDRKVDSRILQLLSQIAQSAHKFTNDVRLLQGLKEIEEPFSEKQVGSSAMAYKRNPMLCERISGLCKYVMALESSGVMVSSTQWLERTLDDSSNRRLTLSQAFLATDAILILWEKVLTGLRVYPKIIESHIKEELPFIITEKLIMEGVKNGGDRQSLHEKIRVYAMESVKESRENGTPNDFIIRIQKDSDLSPLLEDKTLFTNTLQYTGFSLQQCNDFLLTLKNILGKAN